MQACQASKKSLLKKYSQQDTQPNSYEAQIQCRLSH